MAIAAPSYPEFVIHGTVVATREARKKADNTVYAIDMTVETPTGKIYVRNWESSGVETPAVGATVALVVTIRDAKDNWAELSLRREVSDDDLDRIVSASRVAEPAGK